MRSTSRTTSLRQRRRASPSSVSVAAPRCASSKPIAPSSRATSSVGHRRAEHAARRARRAARTARRRRLRRRTSSGAPSIAPPATATMSRAPRSSARGSDRAAIDAALEAVARVGRDAERAARRAHARAGRSCATSRKTSVVASVTSRVAPAHHAGDRLRALGVGDHGHLAASSVRSTPSSVTSVSPARARRTTIVRPAEPARGRTRASAGRSPCST